MLSEPVRACDFRIVSFQAGDKDSLDKQVNEWLSRQSSDVVVLDIMFGHVLAVDKEPPVWSFAMAIAYGNLPKTRGTPKQLG